MANRFVSSTGSNTSPYDTWAKAATNLTTAITGSAAGDVFAIDAAAPGADIAADTTWTFVGNASVIASTNSGTSTITPTTMGTSAYLGAGGATSYAITVTGAFRVYLYGITLRVPGTTNKSLTVASADGSHFELEDCYLWLGTTNAAGRIATGGNGSVANNAYTVFKNCTFRFGNVGQALLFHQRVDLFGGSIASAGSTPTTLFSTGSAAQDRTWVGGDLSLITGTLVADNTSQAVNFDFVQCKLGSGVSAFAAQTVTNKSSARARLFDCSSGDTHGLFQHHDAFGSVLSNTSIKYTGGAASQGWQITTTANCSFGTPFVTPWISLYNTGTSAITPRLEVLRDLSATAYTDAQVWGEFSLKNNSGFVNPTFYSDRQALVGWAAGTAGANQAAGTDTWDGENATHWAGKVDSGASVTPAEAGHIRARVAVAATSVSDLYVDPQIRT